MRCELVTSLDAAVPAYSFRIEADLIGLRGVYAFKANLCCVDNKRVTINDSGNAREIGGLCGRTH